jgi:hypothetical protein
VNNLISAACDAQEKSAAIKVSAVSVNRFMFSLLVIIVYVNSRWAHLRKLTKESGPIYYSISYLFF